MDTTPIVNNEARKKTAMDARERHRVPGAPDPQIRNRESTTAATMQRMQIVKHTSRNAFMFVS